MNGLFDFNEFNYLKKSKVEKNTNSKNLKRIYTKANSEELVKINKTFEIQKDSFFTQNLNFYDFEVFEFDWLVVIINPFIGFKKIICNDTQGLKNFYNEHKSEIWVGYNSRNYDTFILKSILLGLNPKETNDLLILHNKKGFEISDKFKTIDFLNFDIYTEKGLKVLEGYMGNDITETSVSFDLDRILTKSEIMETVKYCSYDVEQTIEVFKRSKEKFDAHLSLIETFKLPIQMINLTQMQLVANILNCKKEKRDDEFDIKLVPTLRIKKYREVVDWFLNKNNYSYKNFYKTNIAGIPHQFGWGGLHGCIEEPIHTKGKLLHIDVTSYYPSIMIRYDYLTRNCKNKEKFKQIYDKRVALKKAGKKKEQAPYKIVLNGTYGVCKDIYSNAYDPRQANNICINGQLMLVDLIEKLEDYCKLIQSNTDGLIIYIEDESNYDKIIEICHKWTDRTGMGLGYDEISEIWQGDVNNYLFKFANSDKLERKGAYVMELSELNYDLPIVNKAIIQFLVNNIPIETTINDCDDLKEFQRIVKISSNYLLGWHNGEYLNDRTFRIYASNDFSDTYIGKLKYKGATVEKFADTPQHCFIWNESVNDVKVPKKLDKKWYINLAKTRLRDKFGVDKEKLL